MDLAGIGHGFFDMDDQYQYGDIGDVPTLIMMQYKECGWVEGRYDHEGRVKANLFHSIFH